MLGYSGVFHNPSNSDRDCRIFNMSIYVVFLYACTHRGSRFIVSEVLLLNVHAGEKVR